MIQSHDDENARGGEVIDEIQEFYTACMELAVTVGLFHSAYHGGISDPPEFVVENYDEKVKEMTELLGKYQEEFMAFGEAYDSEAE